MLKTALFHVVTARAFVTVNLLTERFEMSVYSFIAYGSSKNWIECYKSRPIH